MSEGAIDNFGIAEDYLLRFDGEGEFYMVLVLRRRKDHKGAMVEGVNEEQRLIKHYFVYDREYLERKKQAIVNLCEQNNARAYILPQRRSCRLVLWHLHDKVSETLKIGSMNVHFDHMIRSCVAGMHETTEKQHKRWVIDIDGDDLPTLRLVDMWWSQRTPYTGFNESEKPIATRVEGYSDWVATKIRQAIVFPQFPLERDFDAKGFMPKLSEKYSNNDVMVLQTPHGFHIVTPPFNRTPIMMERYFGAGCPRQDWIKPDAMALLYAPKSITQEDRG